MRKVILDRLMTLKATYNNFPSSTMRWKGFNLVKGLHVSEIPFGDHEYMEQFTDQEILYIYESIIIRVNKQM